MIDQTSQMMSSRLQRKTSQNPQPDLFSPGGFVVLCGGAIDEVEPRAELDASDDGVENRDGVADAELKRFAPLPLLSWRAQDEDAAGVSACALVPRVLFFGGSPFMRLVRASGLWRSFSSLS